MSAKSNLMTTSLCTFYEWTFYECTCFVHWNIESLCSVCFLYGNGRIQCTLHQYSINILSRCHFLHFSLLLEYTDYVHPNVMPSGREQLGNSGKKATGKSKVRAIPSKDQLRDYYSSSSDEEEEDSSNSSSTIASTDDSDDQNGGKYESSSDESSIGTGFLKDGPNIPDIVINGNEEGNAANPGLSSGAEEAKKKKKKKKKRRKEKEREVKSKSKKKKKKSKRGKKSKKDKKEKSVSKSKSKKKKKKRKKKKEENNWVDNE